MLEKVSNDISVDISFALLDSKLCDYGLRVRVLSQTPLTIEISGENKLPIEFEINLENSNTYFLFQGQRFSMGKIAWQYLLNPNTYNHKCIVRLYYQACSVQVEPKFDLIKSTQNLINQLSQLTLEAKFENPKMLYFLYLYTVSQFIL